MSERPLEEYSLPYLWKRIEQLEAKLDAAHNWVLDNQIHSESYNQFRKAIGEQSDE